MNLSLNEILELKNNEDFINKYIDKEIEYKIKTNFYPSKDTWSPGSEEMIRNFIKYHIDYKFDQMSKLLKDIDILTQ